MSDRTSALAIAAVVLIGCGPPQIGPDRDAFRAVDALYTAVGLRDPARLRDADARLGALHASGGLPDRAAKLLASIAREARSGAWESAQARLITFMEGQGRQARTP